MILIPETSTATVIANATTTADAQSTSVIESDPFVNATSRDVAPRALFGAALLQGNKLLIFGGIGQIDTNITSNLTVLDTKDWTWKPFAWQPRDGFSKRFQPFSNYLAL